MFDDFFGIPLEMEKPPEVFSLVRTFKRFLLWFDLCLFINLKQYIFN